MERIGCAVAASTSIPMARASIRARSLSLTMSWSRSCGESSRKKKKEITTTHRHTMPEMMNWSCHGAEVVERVRRDHAGEERAHGRPQRPEPHGHAAPHLRREVAHQRRGRDQDHAFDEADHAVGRGEPALVVDVRDGEELDERNEQRPVDGEVGPADLVGQPADERAERADRVGHDQQVQEELEGHVVVGQQQRRDRPLHVVEVIEHDRREHDDRQVAEPRQGVGVLVELSPPQGVAEPVAARGPLPPVPWSSCRSPFQHWRSPYPAHPHRHRAGPAVSRHRC